MPLTSQQPVVLWFRATPFYNDLVRYMSSDRYWFSLEAENAGGRLRDLMGSTDPKKARRDHSEAFRNFY
jgi:nucleoside diphosphate kinase